ncbi:hypothetical protein KA107_01855 [Candidatus Pacearchaeota archaeon]|nr:hypothetical protein [Candidatus Pacearchaeota archaeon]
MADSFTEVCDILDRNPFAFIRPINCSELESECISSSLDGMVGRIFLGYSISMVHDTDFEDYANRFSVVPVNVEEGVRFLEGGGIWSVYGGEDIFPEKFNLGSQSTLGVSPSFVFKNFENPIPIDFYSDEMKEFWSLDPDRYISLMGENVFQAERGLQKLLRKEFKIKYAGHADLDTVEGLRKSLT